MCCACATDWAQFIFQHGPALCGMDHHEALLQLDLVRLLPGALSMPVEWAFGAAPVGQQFHFRQRFANDSAHARLSQRRLAAAPRALFAEESAEPTELGHIGTYNSLNLLVSLSAADVQRKIETLDVTALQSDSAAARPRQHIIVVASLVDRVCPAA